jgi:hypothetical protein
MDIRPAWALPACKALAASVASETPMAADRAGAGMRDLRKHFMNLSCLFNVFNFQ